MLKLIIEDDEGRKTVVPFMRDEITIGRQEGNTIRLTERNVSRHHARLVRQNGHVLVEDLGSYNGVRINGERIQQPAQVKDGDLIQIGDYDLALQQEGASQPIAPTVRVPSLATAEDLETARADQAETEEPPEEEPGAQQPLEEDEAPGAGETTQLIHGVKRRQSTAVIRMDQVEANRPRKVIAVEAEEAPRLVVVSPEFKGQEFACISTEMRVGRTDDNDIALDHRSLSRTHAKVVREDTGEWRIIDMQSANGLSVNGESYAQTALSHGDLIELGHVKLRFIGPGQSTEGLMHDGAARRSRKGLFLFLGLTLLGLGGGAIWFRLAHPPAPTPGPTVGEVQPPPQQTSPPPEQTPPPTGETPRDTPPKAPEDLAQKLRQAQEALSDRRPADAIALLEPLKDASTQRPPKIQEQLDQAQAELAVQKSLDKATAEYNAHNFQEALKTLKAAEKTTVFQTQYTSLKAQAESALNTPPAPEPTPPKPKGPTVRKETEEANRLFLQGKDLLKQAQTAEAEPVFKKCLEADREFSKCYLMLGATLAKLGRLEEGARNYRRFLELAPNDPSAETVKQILEKYEKSKKPTGGGK